MNNNQDSLVLSRVIAMAAVLFALFVFLKALIAQGKPEVTFAPVVKGLVLSDVECSAFHSRFTGHDYQVYVSLPASYVALSGISSVQWK